MKNSIICVTTKVNQLVVHLVLGGQHHQVNQVNPDGYNNSSVTENKSRLCKETSHDKILSLHDSYMHCSLPWGLVPLLLPIIHNHPVDPKQTQQTCCLVFML